MNRFTGTIIFLSLALYGASCWEVLVDDPYVYIDTWPMHDPIYPNAEEDVVYSLHATSDQEIQRVRLYETIEKVVYQYDPAFPKQGPALQSVSGELLLKTWEPGSKDIKINFPKAGGYSEAQLITYRFEVQSGQTTRSHQVGFAIRPYPPSNGPSVRDRLPAPVYFQGDVAQAKDVVFIADGEATCVDDGKACETCGLIAEDTFDVFREQCRLMITDAMWEEKTVGLYQKFFNYFINPMTGKATELSTAETNPHVKPCNSGTLEFAEMKVLMHDGVLQDYASGNYTSSEMGSRGTMLHEGGHVLFHLSDEYEEYGLHEEQEFYPNNWCTLKGAEDAAQLPAYAGLSAQKIKSTECLPPVDGTYKLCDDSCQMKNGGEKRTYDEPCRKHIRFVITADAEEDVEPDNEPEDE